MFRNIIRVDTQVLKALDNMLKDEKDSRLHDLNVTVHLYYGMTGVRNLPCGILAHRILLLGITLLHIQFNHTISVLGPFLGFKPSERGPVLTCAKSLLRRV